MSDIGKERQNWLEQVKADASELTRQRLAVEMPKVVAAEEARMAAKEEITAHSAASYDGAVPELPAAPATPVVEEIAEPVEVKPEAKKGKK